MDKVIEVDNDRIIGMPQSFMSVIEKQIGFDWESANQRCIRLLMKMRESKLREENSHISAVYCGTNDRSIHDLDSD